MEWNPVLEDRLKRAKRMAPWLWPSYFMMFVGLWAAAAGYFLWPAELRYPGMGAVPGLLIFLVGACLAGPSKKAATELRELKIQKQSSGA